jgi:hypothetical protein
MFTEFALVVPVQLCGPVSVILSSLVALPMNWSNGAAKLSAQAFSVTFKVSPTSEASQCWVTFQLPLRSGQLGAPELPPPAGAGESLSEPQAGRPRRRQANRNLIIAAE